MKNLRINKENVVSLLLAGSIALSAYAGIRDIKRTRSTDEPKNSEVSEITETVINELDGVTIDSNLINGSEYATINKENENKILMDTYLYDDKGQAISKLKTGEIINVVAANNNVALISLPDGTTGYALLNYLAKNYYSIDGYAFIKKGTPIYSDNGLHELAYTADYDDMIRVYYLTPNYATIMYNGEAGYVNPNILLDDFIYVNLTSQQMNCYLDYELARSYPTRTGKLSTPTHEGIFDIDWKAKDWEFTTYPGNYAKYWIAYDEVNGEGIHDLIGDDEENYGNYGYQQYGSHGCVRVPGEASEFVYNNYDVGDMVIVRKK